MRGPSSQKVACDRLEELAQLFFKLGATGFGGTNTYIAMMENEIGEMLVTRAPHIRHQGAAGKLHVRLEVWSETTLRLC